MILLDTNIISAVMRPAPPAVVLEWLDRQDALELFLSSITIAEIELGLQLLPAGRRRRGLSERFVDFVARGFDQRIVDFDREAAIDYATLMAHRRRIGRPMSQADGLIAGVARSRGMVLATRNVRDFEECGFEIINPFSKLKESAEDDS